MVEGDLRETGRLVMSRRVETLEARAVVGVSVRVVAVEDEVARDLDLVRGVVREVPGVGRITQSNLEQDGRNEQHRADDSGEPDPGPSWPRGKAPRGRGGESDGEPCEHGGRAEDAEIHSRSAALTSGPRSPRGCTDGGRTASPRRRGPGSPGSRALPSVARTVHTWTPWSVLRGVRVGRPVISDGRPSKLARPVSGAASVALEALHGSSMASLSARERTKLAATASTSHVTGSSKKPL